MVSPEEYTRQNPRGWVPSNRVLWIGGVWPCEAFRRSFRKIRWSWAESNVQSIYFPGIFNRKYIFYTWSLTQLYLIFRNDLKKLFEIIEIIHNQNILGFWKVFWLRKNYLVPLWVNTGQIGVIGTVLYTESESQRPEGRSNREQKWNGASQKILHLENFLGNLVLDFVSGLDLRADTVYFLGFLSIVREMDFRW